MCSAYVYGHVCGYVHICARTQACVTIWVWRSEVNIGCLVNHSPLYSLKLVLMLNPELHWFSQASWFPKSSCPYLPSTGIIGTWSHAQIFYMGAGELNSDLVLVQETRYGWSISPDPLVSFSCTFTQQCLKREEKRRACEALQPFISLSPGMHPTLEYYLKINQVARMESPLP